VRNHHIRELGVAARRKARRSLDEPVRAADALSHLDAVTRELVQQPQRRLLAPREELIGQIAVRQRPSKLQGADRYSFLFMRASGAQLDEVAKLMDADVLRPIVDRTYRFDEAPQALAHVEGGRAKGKVVITMV
jgi:Zinc-binding dehydrogenase